MKKTMKRMTLSCIILLGMGCLAAGIWQASSSKEVILYNQIEILPDEGATGTTEAIGTKPFEGNEKLTGESENLIGADNPLAAADEATVEQATETEDVEEKEKSETSTADTLTVAEHPTAPETAEVETTTAAPVVEEGELLEKKQQLFSPFARNNNYYLIYANDSTYPEGCNTAGLSNSYTSCVLAIPNGIGYVYVAP
jgi:hypothetical protein